MVVAVACDFDIIPKKSSPNQIFYEDFPLIFPSKKVIALTHMFKLLIHLEYFVHGLRVQLPSAYGSLVFSRLFVEEFVLSPLNSLGTLTKNHLTIYLSNNLWTLYPTLYMSVFMSVPPCFDYNCFVINILF